MGKFIRKWHQTKLVSLMEYYDIRSSVRKYNEIFMVPKTSNIIDATLDNMLKNKYKKLEHFYRQIGIKIDGEKITDTESEVRIIDNLIKSGNGNPILNVACWNLRTESLKERIPIYSAEFNYPATPHYLVKIEINGETVLEY